jgi:2-keto-4-pentenoate hydratase
MTRDEAIGAAAARLRRAHDSGTPCRNLRDLLEGSDVDAGYAVQEINTGHWQGSGRRLVGRKIGLTSRAVQTQLGVDQPDYGMLWADMAYSDAEPIPLSRTMQPKAEGEIAFVMARDLTGEHIVLTELIDAIAYALPAIEVVGSRIEGWDIQILDTIADNASSGLFVLGTTPRKLSDFDPRLCGMVLERRGDPVSTGAGAACLGNPLTATVWLARKMVEVGRPLKAGDIVLSGALGPLVPVSAGDVLELRINGLGDVRAAFDEA